MRLALDAMGGDAAPREPVLGAVQAAQAYPEAEIVLVGDEAAIRRTLSEVGSDPDSLGLSFHHAPECIEMGESPVESLRNKPNSSIAQATALVAEGRADAVISAGNTGAAVAAATLALRPLQGVRRPGIAITFPASGGHTTVIDVGANLQCKPIHLLQYAIMASIYHRYVVGVERPTVGLLNVGSEAGKGTPFTKEVFGLLQASTLHFVGNVEGSDIYNGKCNVVVCDGFVGNVVLKATESLAGLVLQRLAEAGRADAWSRLGVNLSRSVLRDLEHSLDFAEYGGAPLLGVEGACIICHGKSHARALKSAIGVALSFSRHHVNEHIVAAIAGEQTALASSGSEMQRRADA